MGNRPLLGGAIRPNVQLRAVAIACRSCLRQSRPSAIATSLDPRGLVVPDGRRGQEGQKLEIRALHGTNFALTGYRCGSEHGRGK